MNTAKVLADIGKRHAILPTLNIADKESVFFYNVIREVADILGINIKYPVKHEQTIRKLQQAHAIITASLKMASVEHRKRAQFSTDCNPELQYNLPFQC